MDTHLSGVSLSELQIFGFLISIQFQGSLHEREQVRKETPFMTSSFWKGPFRGHMAQCKEYILRKGRAARCVFAQPFCHGVCQISMKSRVFFLQNLVYLNET